MTAVRRAVVRGLEAACEHVDRLRDWPPPFRWVAARLGCPSGLAVWSARLDERWQTGVWTPPAVCASTVDGAGTVPEGCADPR